MQRKCNVLTITGDGSVLFKEVLTDVVDGSHSLSGARIGPPPLYEWSINVDCPMEGAIFRSRFDLEVKSMSVRLDWKG